MFGVAESNKTSFLEQNKAAREERAMEKRKDIAAIIIQSVIRGWLARRRFTKIIM